MCSKSREELAGKSIDKAGIFKIINNNDEASIDPIRLPMYILYCLTVVLSQLIDNRI